MDKMQNFLKNRDRLLVKGMKKGLVHRYPDILFDYLRPYSLGGMPASIVLFINELCNGKCYDRAELMSLAFDDAIVVHGDIESLRFIADGVSPEHAFVITKQFGGDKEWVVDTSAGLIFDKNFYYKLEKVKENNRYTKEEVMNFSEIKSIIASVNTFNDDKYMLTLTLPNIEKAVKNSNHIGTCLYRDKILKEIEMFKSKIGYFDMLSEVERDINLMKTDPIKLDEKFGIVRDKNGFEVSRNGIPNPYYVSIEDRIKIQEKFDKIKNNPNELKKYYGEMVKEIEQEHKDEENKLNKIVELRLEKIKENPTQNFYEEPEME